MTDGKRSEMTDLNQTSNSNPPKRAAVEKKRPQEPQKQIQRLTMQKTRGGEVFCLRSLNEALRSEFGEIFDGRDGWPSLDDVMASAICHPAFQTHLGSSQAATARGRLWCLQEILKWNRIAPRDAARKPATPAKSATQKTRERLESEERARFDAMAAGPVDFAAIFASTSAR